MESRNSAEEKNLAEKKSELLSLLLAEQGLSTSSKHLISSRKKTSLPIPLAYDQEQLWFLAQLEPTNPFYHIPLVLSLEGPLQVSTLEASLNALLERHESLRTCFHATDGRPFQVMRSEPAPVRVGSSAYRALRDRLTVTLSELSRGRARPP